jgi:hypothetical protein
MRVFMNSSCLLNDFLRPRGIRSDMRAYRKMSLAKMSFGLTSYDHAVAPAEAALDIAVVFTTVKATLAALKRAGALATDLSARITLVVPQVVPYPLPLGNPPVPLSFNERLFRVIAGQSSIETSVRLYLCRDSLDTVLAILPPRSLVVVGARSRWWLSTDKRLARSLRRAGHQVIVAEGE